MYTCVHQNVWLAIIVSCIKPCSRLHIKQYSLWAQGCTVQIHINTRWHDTTELDLCTTHRLVFGTPRLNDLCWTVLIFAFMSLRDGDRHCQIPGTYFKVRNNYELPVESVYVTIAHKQWNNCSRKVVWSEFRVLRMMALQVIIITHLDYNGTVNLKAQF